MGCPGVQVSVEQKGASGWVSWLGRDGWGFPASCLGPNPGPDSGTVGASG